MDQPVKVLVVDDEKDILETQAKQEGKPAKAIEKIINGRLEKFYSEICLLEQPFIKDEDKKIGDLVQEMIASLGENIVLRRFVRYQVGE